MHDVIVIGGGIAGFSAALYTSRKGLNTKLISCDIGGQANLTTRILNYPGIKEIGGTQLVNTISEQALEFGTEFVHDKVVKVKEIKKGFSVWTENNGTFHSKSVVIASGKNPRKMGFKGEQKFLGNGVFTCTTCDGPLFNNKTVAVVGKRLDLVSTVIELSRICKKVYAISENFNVKRKVVESLKNVELIENAKPVEVKGKKFVQKIVIKKKDKKQVLNIDGVFVKNGYVVDIKPYNKLVKTNKKNEIVIDKHCNTNKKGIFAAGDITNIKFKQAVISAGEGAKAGLQAYQHVTGKKNLVDWTH